MANIINEVGDKMKLNFAKESVPDYLKEQKAWSSTGNKYKYFELFTKKEFEEKFGFIVTDEMSEEEFWQNIYPDKPKDFLQKILDERRINKNG